MIWNQSWVFIGRTDVEAETLTLWPPDAESWLIWKDPDAREDGGQEEKGTTEDETVGWHHWLDGHEFEQALGDDEEQGSLVCRSPWSRKESDTIEQLNKDPGIVPVYHRLGIGHCWYYQSAAFQCFTILVIIIRPISIVTSIRTIGLQRVGHDWSDVALLSIQNICLLIK